MERNLCVFTDSDDLELLYTFKNMPIYCGHAGTNSCAKQDIFLDMSVWISRRSGSIQINPLVPLDILYQKQHNDSPGALWTEHHRKLSYFIEKYKPQKVLEIGAGTGKLSKIYLSRNPECEWTTIEMNAELLKNRTDIKVIEGKYTVDKIPKDIDLVVHSHFLEHLYEPLKFLKELSQATPVDTLQIFSIPNHLHWLKNCYGNTIFFEHTYYLDDIFVERFLLCAGHSIIEKNEFQKHSVFYASKNNKQIKEYQWPTRYEENKKIYNNYIKYLTNNLERVNKIISTTDKKVFLFGAHIFSQIMFVMGIPESRVEAILDNSKAKVGNRLYGTSKLVKHPEVLEKTAKPLVILFAGSYTKEISEQILNINKNTELVVL